MPGAMRVEFVRFGEEKAKGRAAGNLAFVFSYLKDDYRENKVRLFSNLHSEMRWISATDILVRQKKNVFI